MIRLSAIGDVVVTTPVSRALRSAFPDAYICWVVEPKSRDMIIGNPHLDDVLVWDRSRSRGLLHQWKSYRWLSSELRSRAFDVAIDFQGLLRSGLVAKMSGARYRIGNTECKEPAEWFYTHRVPRPCTSTSSRQRCLDLLKPLDIHTTDRRMVIPIDSVDREACRAVLDSNDLKPGQFACFAPVTTWAHKHWFDERWGALADGIRDDLGLNPVFLGGPGDSPKIARILAGMRGSGLDLAGKTTLKLAAAILEQSRLTVAVDTGLLHIAAGVGTSLIGLCGASYWPGFRDYENFTLVREPFPCSPCLHHPICTQTDCMRTITPRHVLALCRERLAESGPRLGV